MLSLAFSVYDTEITAFVVAAVLLQLAALQAALEAILKSRTAPGAIAWSLSLTFLPLFMLPLWWIFGRRKFKGYARAKRRGTSRISQVARDLHAQLLQYDAGHGQTLGAIRNLTQMPTTEGNSVEVLIDGAAFQAALERIIREAEHYLLIEFYILRDDNIGLALRDLLIEKAQQGVEIHVLYDEIGSFQLSRGYIDQLRNHGIDIRSFHTTKGRRNRFQINFRNHRKTVIADGRVGMTGGSNIGDE
ncbi:MAG: phospholipase D-like domain-containing protein [Spongiibacteraceae bacterium]|jgi:cardiolipin synthase|nr:phospholipase D-like domain-containing protein [Spongiibacteraceae bacterium]